MKIHYFYPLADNISRFDPGICSLKFKYCREAGNALNISKLVIRSK